MCDTIIPQQLTEITFEWFIFFTFLSSFSKKTPTSIGGRGCHGYTKVFLQHNPKKNIFAYS